MVRQIRRRIKLGTKNQDQIRCLEAVTVCVNYADYLSITIKFNKQIFDDWVVVTSASDEETQTVCANHGVKCIVSNRLYEEAVFNKGKALNDGLSVLSKRDWLLSLDSDVILPRDFRDEINSLYFDRKTLYGVRRVEPPLALHTIKEDICCADIVSWQNGFIKRKVPLGYFQLFAADAIKEPIFSEECIRANVYDMKFLDRWNYKEIIPKLRVVHLPHGELGTNWCGRKSGRFTLG
jgi:hypothetical protein